MELQNREVFFSGCLAQHFKRETVSTAALEHEPMMYLYEIIGIAEDTENGQELMVYRALYGDGGLWVRPADMWNETIERDGKTFKRFEKL